MKSYSIKIEEHEDFGVSGITVHGLNRNYFQPAVGGAQVAHDILEHTVKPHWDGYIDEYMALGGIIAGRIESGAMSIGNRPIVIGDIASDVSSLVRSALCVGDDICAEECNSYIQDESLMEDIRKAVKDGMIEGYEEYYYDEEYAIYEADVKNIVGWICKGIQLFRKRFRNKNIWFISNTVFNTIEEVVDQWVNRNELGDRGILHVNLDTGYVCIDEVWE
jgi:hypothetical protein